MANRNHKWILAIISITVLCYTCKKNPSTPWRWMHLIEPYLIFKFLMMKFVLQLWVFGILLLISTNLNSQQKTNNNNLVYVDKQGVLRWTKDNAEASFFGVNYTTPFAYAYRAQKALGVDLEKAIQQDVYQLARLGLDAFRVHVWDTEISDTAGNLLEN